MAKSKKEKKILEDIVEEDVTTPESQAPVEEAEVEESKTESKTYTQDEMDKVKEELNKVAKERDEYLDLAQRQKAEFDNYRKRTETQRFEANGNGVRDAITAILPVIDNMKRALSHADEVPADDPLKQGITMVFKNFIEVLQSQGLERIDALGKEFDPNFHHAVVEGEANEEFKSGCVMEVLQEGYIVKEKIIRYAMVKVAK